MPLISKFLAGATRIRPMPVTLPGWSLLPVLKALCEGPWEPLETVDLKFITLKTVFLLAITSAHRVSELQALSLDQGCYRFASQDILVLHTNFDFIPKCKSDFHRVQEIKLRSFFPDPKILLRLYFRGCVQSELLMLILIELRTLGSPNSYLFHLKRVCRVNLFLIV